MSVQKVHSIKKAQKPQGKCGKCGAELLQGDPYIWWTMGFRSNHKYKRCTRPFCFPKPSERETSKVASILAAQESFEDALDGMDNPEDIKSAVDEVAEAVRGVAEEYREAADAWEQGNAQLEEYADHYESQADEMESWESPGDDEPEKCEKHSDGYEPEENDEDYVDAADCAECTGMAEDWIEEIRESAKEQVDNFESM